MQQCSERCGCTQFRLTWSRLMEHLSRTQHHKLREPAASPKRPSGRRVRVRSWVSRLGPRRYNAGDFQDDTQAFSLSSWLATVPAHITAQARCRPSGIFIFRNQLETQNVKGKP